ncbi:MAG TPA: LacI family DNA-binding transcriptional regulator [Candidatus Bathyarchaeia archaeon]|nr:LacI family DNA-binding transcriptional regulator [Candidatus Bathyarchaeia archaeon]
MPDRPKTTNRPGTTLKDLAKHLGLTKGTVSAVLNDSPYAKAIPQHTKDRIFAAAQELNYHPNFFARTLRKKRTYTVGVVCAELGDAYGSVVISGIEEVLSERKYFFVAVVHHHNQELMRQYSDILKNRGAEGFITIDTTLSASPPVPTVAVSGHEAFDGVTNITLDHVTAARVVLNHLTQLGHRNIAFIKGQPLSIDTESRWGALAQVAEEMGIRIQGELVIQLPGDDPSPQLGYETTRQLLSRNVPFTSLVVYNDISAVGAIRAIKETGMRVPEDISVVGFDDIREAAYHVPSLTTVRQPMRKIGAMAAQALLDRIEGHDHHEVGILVEPELVVRESTGPAPNQPPR